MIPDEAQQATLLSAGEIDFAEAVPVTAIPELMAQGVKVTTVGGNNQAVMYMNPTRPPFDDLNVRQAISYAFPYDDVLEGVYFGAASRGGGPIPRTTPTFDPDAPFYYQDLDKARELLAESGYPDGFETQLHIDATLAFAPELAIVVQASLAPIGIDVEIVRLGSGAFSENVFAEDSTKTDPLEARINPMDFFLFYFGSGSLGERAPVPHGTLLGSGCIRHAEQLLEPGGYREARSRQALEPRRSCQDPAVCGCTNDNAGRRARRVGVRTSSDRGFLASHWWVHLATRPNQPLLLRDQVILITR